MERNLFKLFLIFICTFLGIINFSVGVENYYCDRSKCKAPICFCAGTTPPGNLNINDVPLFVELTFDDAVQDRTINIVNQLLGNRKNPNGCPIRATYYVSIQYTNMSMVTEWYASGQEVADHTITHVGKTPENEITGCKQALNAFAGIPNGKISGFRTPFLDWTPDVFNTISKLGFEYDSSVTSLRDDASWPYTLDNGLYNDCTGNYSCDSVKHPGFFELPMAAIMDGTTPHLMDPYLDSNSTDVVKKWLQDNFNWHLANNKTPFGLYLHPVQLDNSTFVPGRANPAEMIKMLQEFLDWALAQPNVWFVTSQQLLTWMKDPVPASQLINYAPFKCQAPKIDKKICNGLSDAGLLETCNFNYTSIWSTCYGCPTSDISLAVPVPPGGDRHRLPNTCDTVWWDPIENSCLCNDSSCAYTDTSVPMPNKNSTNNPGGDGKSNTNPNGQKSDASSLLYSYVLMLGLMFFGLFQFL